jgi:hypothetical protein
VKKDRNDERVGEASQVALSQRARRIAQQARYEQRVNNSVWNSGELSTWRAMFFTLEQRKSEIGNRKWQSKTAAVAPISHFRFPIFAVPDLVAF